jgi:2',3'-cyclic-nucleotide 2'-phosphodiesterase (5'-nucleotidase family)
LARRATLLDTVLNEGAPVLLVDAGGLFGPRNKLERDQTRFVCEVTAGFGYDAIGLGQADLNYGVGFLREMMEKNRLPFTNANVRDKATGQLLLPPWLVVQKGGVRFGIVSVLDPAEPFITMTAQDEAYQVDDPVATLRTVIPELRKQAQTIILLSHLDLPRTESLLKEVAGVDIAVVGHTHQAMPAERIVGKTVMLAAGFEGRTVGRLSGQFGRDGVMQGFQVKLIELDEKIAGDAVILEKVTQLKQKLEEARQSLRGRHQQVKGSATEQFLTQYECRKCHADIFAKLEGSRHNAALASLARKGMSQEPDCLACHTTGYEFKGGYDEKPPANRLTNVQCEACHGYGSLHRRDGRWKAEARSTCVACHDQQNSPKFNFATYWEKIRH